MKIKPFKVEVLISELESVKGKPLYGVCIFPTKEGVTQSTNKAKYFAKYSVLEIGQGIKNRLKNGKPNPKCIWDLVVYIKDNNTWLWADDGDILYIENPRLKQNTYKNKQGVFMKDYYIVTDQAKVKLVKAKK